MAQKIEKLQKKMINYQIGRKSNFPHSFRKSYFPQFAKISKFV